MELQAGMMKGASHCVGGGVEKDYLIVKMSTCAAVSVHLVEVCLCQPHMLLLGIQSFVLGIDEKAAVILIGQNEVYVHVELTEESAEAMLVIHVLQVSVISNHDFSHVPLQEHRDEYLEQAVHIEDAVA